MAKHKILIVDDEESLCEILQFNLEVEGYEADVAYSAEQALEMHPERYSLILLDVMMGEMSGFKMARILKSNPETARVPVIFCTARDTEDDTVAGLNLGADDYIAKPFSIREVLARVRSVLRRTASPQTESEVIGYEGLEMDLRRKSCTVDGEEVYASDIAGNPGEWFATSPDWKVEGGKLVQPNPSATSSILLQGRQFDARKAALVSVEFDATKLGGKEGFVLHFGNRNSDNTADCYQMTLGSFGNAWTIFQSVSNHNAFVLNTERPTQPIETGRTYHVKLVIRNQETFECWIDGVKALVYDNSYVQRQYALAGLDRKNGEVIVKVINAEDVPMPVKFDFRNAEFEPLGKRICLWADSKFDENTFEERNRIVPVEEVFNHVSPQMEVTFRPQSMTVLRLKLKNTHRQ